jgi:hypothetical protein
MTTDADALSDIRQMIIVAIRTTESLGKVTHQQNPEAFDVLSFSLHDALRRIREIEDDGSAAAVDVGKAGPDAEGSGPRDTSKIVQAYGDMESFLYDVVHMIQIADDMTFDLEAPDDQKTWNQFSFALRHGRRMLEAFQGRYHRRDFGGYAESLVDA